MGNTFFIRGFGSEIDYRGRIVRAVEKPAFSIAVVMQRRAAQSRWADVVWEPHGVLPDPGGDQRLLREDGAFAQWLHPGFTLVLHKDEGDGYYFNVSSQSPRVFVLWRMDGDRGVPAEVTVSSEEAGRWMDGGHSVDGVAMPPEIFAWVGDYVEKNYRPQPEERIKPRSFVHPKDRV
jgi:uncharacterized protein DUF3305